MQHRLCLTVEKCWLAWTETLHDVCIRGHYKHLLYLHSVHVQNVSGVLTMLLDLQGGLYKINVLFILSLLNDNDSV